MLPVTSKHPRLCWNRNISALCQVAGPPLRDFRWTASFCTPWSILAPSFAAVGQLCSVRRAAAVPSSTCTSPSSRLALRDGKMDKWVKNGHGKAICQLHKLLRPAVPIPGHGRCELLFGIWKPMCVCLRVVSCDVFMRVIYCHRPRALLRELL